ncbi:recombinase family protein, partial [Klebsiella pneumoniae]|uniref:recombinase family protein n=1 Tax=Klebsiella pneumoniae TaxID=573 RepID=UPI001F4AB5DB
MHLTNTNTGRLWAPSDVYQGQNKGVPIKKSRRVQLGHRAAIYCRVSTADQSCERQEFDLRAFAGWAGDDGVGIFKETGSGTKTDRAERKKGRGEARDKKRERRQGTERYGGGGGREETSQK